MWRGSGGQEHVWLYNLSTAQSGGQSECVGHVEMRICTQWDEPGSERKENKNNEDYSPQEICTM
jgi:hypothetical protein